MSKIGLQRTVFLSLFACAAITGLLIWGFRSSAAKAHADDNNGQDAAPVAQVTVVKPMPGGVERTTSQPGTVHAFESEEVYAKVSGFLIQQKVDIGTRVKKGELLAQIDAPQLLKEEEHAAANLEQVKAQVRQMEARIREAEADLTATKTLVVQRQAEILRTKSNLEYRKKQYDRIEKLAKQAAVDDNLVDEKFEQVESARAWRDASEAAVNTALADVEAKKAKVSRAQADLSAAQANLKVAQATLDKAQVFVEFTKIRSHYDGMVTRRSFHNGDFIRDPEHGGSTPLFTIQRTDKMRLIVHVPDNDAPFADQDDPVDLNIATLPGVVFPGLRIARTANSQEERTRTMRVEIDVPNPQTLLRDGMYGEVTIHLQKAPKEAFRVTSSALHKKGNHWFIHVVRDGLTHSQKVKVGQNNGHTAEILAGLKASDEVIVDQTGPFQDGVEAIVTQETEAIRESSTSP